ncbi:large conductance mechanosensitive channel protein MscL [Egicoccus sp. AB-alg6-2]|uniref:large conductance mechanosensitive channel protein MscL n=1 Tax=Egicoccus sp. AB-alg6-2 TaxID=3242692 RepID=UPI00359D3003
MVHEFREFINRGNFVDLAVGFVMGVAVTGVVTAIVERLIMPLVAVLVGQPNFDSVGQFACGAEGCAGSVGAVLTALVNFLLIALVLFAIVKAYNRLQRSDPAEPEPEADPEEVVLLREIRDALSRPPTP